MKKKALLVGINKYKYVSCLRGCVNDVKNMNHILQTYFEFKQENIRSLIDESVTRDHLMSRLSWLIDDAEPGDVLVFHFSGHGSQIIDRGVLDELNDHRDEILCLYDMDFRNANSFLTDDDFSKTFNRLPKGVNLSVIIDSCHSGTATREIESLQREVKATPTIQYRYLLPPDDIALRERSIPISVRRFTKSVGRNCADVGINHILLAACEDRESAADAYIADSFNGAFSYNLCKWIRDTNGNLTYQDLIIRVQRSLLHNGFAQKPQLEGPRELQGRKMFSATEESQVRVSDSLYKNRYCITQKNLSLPVAQGIILGTASEFNGTVRVNNLSSSKTRDLIGESNPEVIEGLENGGFIVSNVLEFQPVKQRSLDKGEQLEPLQLQVECGPKEETVFLTAENGIWKWYFGESERTYRTGLRAPGVESHIKSFKIPFITQEITTRGIRSKFIYCLKFIKDWVDEQVEGAINGIISKIEEKNVKEGFGVITDDFNNIQPFNDLPSLKGKKILLFIHGTFSSTAGGFGAITGDTIKRWKNKYDMILGFDHKTLSKTPKENSREMLKILPDGFQVDIISHSRGGLVLRSLTELCQSELVKKAIVVNKAIMVGTPNAGTTLADPIRWKTMADLLTTLFSLTGGAWLKIALPFLTGVIRYLSSKLDNPEVIPGLWAQNPNSPFLTTLNPDQKPPNTTYAAITSDFEPRNFFQKAVLENILDMVADAFFGYANDMVVNTKNMTSIEIADEYHQHFTQERNVHHCNYFTFKETIDAIERFMET
ncbi:MAG: caspase family protein [bacterium]